MAPSAVTFLLQSLAYQSPHLLAPYSLRFTSSRWFTQHNAFAIPLFSRRSFRGSRSVCIPLGALASQPSDVSGTEHPMPSLRVM